MKRLLIILVLFLNLSESEFYPPFMYPPMLPYMSPFMFQHQNYISPVEQSFRSRGSRKLAGGGDKPKLFSVKPTVVGT